ncbi:uncharacterized LOC105273720 [Fopius arisanus]|uniref:Uncharacterized LOC105273720 n=1 Tax=Fopius arisanus TaxID=64838 RepID=A0AAR9ID84_9HYME|nr:uncharacterized LOC105273720 [Fopius arisanus]KAG8362512.1 EcKinase 16 [Fopius arisanus]
MPTSDDKLPVEDLKGLLSLKFGNEIEILETTWKNLTDPGENFGSLILAVNVVFTKNSSKRLLHTVVKLPPPSAYLVQLFNSPATFSKELVFYRDVTPVFLQLQKDNGIIDAESTWLGPEYYGGRLGLKSEFDNQACIVLENLNYSGYKMIDRLEGLTRDQTEYAVKQLAKLHAITIATRIQKPKIFENVVMPALENAANDEAVSCVMDMIKKAVSDLGNIPDAKADMDDVHRTIERMMELEESMEKDDNWFTFVHSDFWGNNMMFKFKENSQEIVDMKIVDFQLGNYDYGVKDLIFFLISSPRIELAEAMFDDMVELYYQSFVESLRRLNVDASKFTREKLLRLLDMCGPLKLAQCLAMTQVIKSVPGSVPKIETIDNKENFLQIGDGEAYRDKLLQVMQIFKKRRWLLTT